MGFYPYLYDEWEDDNDRCWSFSTYPYRNGDCLQDGGNLGYQGFHQHDGNHTFDNGEDGWRCFDSFCQEDQNSDGIKSFREAYEFAWARIPGGSALAREHQGGGRYHAVNMTRGSSDPVYYWPGYDTPFCQENDSSGTVSLTGRGGKVNWCYGENECNWTSTKKYIVTDNLIFPEMGNPPTTTIGTGDDVPGFFVYPGKKIVFEREVEPIINVDFTAFDENSYWSGVCINNTALSMQHCEISYCNTGVSVVIDDYWDNWLISLDSLTISHCYDGVFINDYGAWFNFNLTGSEISNCVFGLNLFHATYPWINNCRIHHCSSIGIYSPYTWVGQINDTEVFNNTDFGIVLEDFNILYLRNNDVHNNPWWGIFILGPSNWIDLFSSGDPNEVNNEVRENRYGIDVCEGADGSTILLGDDGIDRPGWNRIFNNTHGAVYNGLDSTTIKAEMNFWGSDPPDTNDFIGDIDYDPWWDGEEGGGGIIESKGGDKQIADEMDEELREIANLFRSREFDDIPNRCTRVINRRPASHHALLALSFWYKALWCLDEVRALHEDIPNFLRARRFDDSDLRIHSELLRASCDVRSREYDGALERLGNLTHHNDTPDNIKLSAYSQIAGVYQYCLDDPESAAGILRLIIEQYRDSPYARIAEARLDIILHRIDSQPPNRPGNKREQTPSTPDLLYAYPNPFNSEVRINYRMTESGSAKVSIFDLNGRELAVVFDGYSNAGLHQVIWDGTNYSSGVYICRFEHMNSSEFKKLVLMR